MIAQPDIPDFLDRRPLIFSYTFLHAYANVCPHQAYRTYIVRDIPYVATPEMAWGNDVHTAFEYRIGGGKPLPESMHQWECFAAPFDGNNVQTEQKLAIDATGRPTKYFGDDVFLRGKIDTTLLKNTTAYLADWKTGGSKYENRFELDVQAVLLHATNPGLTRIVGQYVWLKENRLGKLYDLSDTGAAWKQIASIAGDVRRDKQSGTFVKRRGPLCDWCRVFDCENNSNPKKPWEIVDG